MSESPIDAFASRFDFSLLAAPASIRGRLTCTLCTALLSTTATAPAVHAQSATEVAPVVVSGTRFERSEVSLPAAMQIIGREQIQASGARNVGELLRGRGGVQVRDLYGDGSRTTIDMRGFGETAHGNTLVLVDGRRLNNTDIADPDLSVVSLDDVQRVEIIQGSAGVLYGDQAVGGVVNIITQQARGFSAEAKLSTGSYSRRGLHVSAAHRLDNGLSFRLSGRKRHSDNYRRNNETDYENVLARVAFDHAGGSVFAEYHQVDEDLRTPGSLTRAELLADRKQFGAGKGNDFIDTDTVGQRIGLRQVLGNNLSLEAELANRESDTDFLLGFGGVPATGPANTQYRHVTEFTPRLVGVWDTDNGELLLTAGYDLARTDYELLTGFGLQSNEQHVSGYYAQTVLPVLPRVDLTLGARYARVSNDLLDTFAFPAGIDIDDNEFLTEAGLAFRPGEQWRVFVRRDENLRFAKVDEYTNPVPGTILDTQTGVSWEFGAEWSDGRHSARAMVYRLDLEDEIVLAPGVGAFGFPANTNLDSTRRNGAIVGVGWQALEALHLSADWSYTDARVRSGALDGQRVPFVARHSVRLGVEYEAMKGLSVQGEFIAVSDRVFSGDFDRQLPLFPGHGVVNLGLTYAIDDWTFGARIDNLLDNEYSDFGARSTVFPPPAFAATQVENFYPAPERNFWLSASYRFGM